MNIICQLRKFTEGPWTGIRIMKTNIPASGRTMRLCEAIARSFDQALLLPSHELSCPGARRSFGLDGDDRTLSKTISQTTGVPAIKIRKILVGRPKLSKPVAGLKLGEIEDPEVVVGYVRPLAAMKLLRLWQSRFGGNLTVSLSTFLSICSSVAGVILKPRLVYSLGCPNSREVGGLPPDAVAVIFPTELARVLFEGSGDMPTYEYECEACGHRFDAFQNMTDASLETCPNCGGKVRRLIGSGAGIIFKGSGFHATDYRSSQPSCERERPCCERDTPCDERPCVG